MTGKNYQKKNPIFGAALLIISAELKQGKRPKGMNEIVRGIIKDLGLTREQVEAYILEHKEELIRTCQDQGLI